MRRSAKILNIHKTTVKRKLIYLAQKSKLNNAMFLKKLWDNPVTHLQMDDLITSEHTKLKPLSVSIAVDVKTRAILGAQVSKIPAFGHLAERSRRKYGHRKNKHADGLSNLFSKIQGCVDAEVLIESDEHNLYPTLIDRYFPMSIHKSYKSERGSIAGQGELKKVKYDPLFYINHTCAMLRANINRLIRRT